MRTSDPAATSKDLDQLLKDAAKLGQDVRWLMRDTQREYGDGNSLTRTLRGVNQMLETVQTQLENAQANFLEGG